MKEIFKTLSKQQHVIMDVLCAKQHPYLPATDIPAAALGALCAKGLVNVEDGKVHSTCVMLWNMTFHKKMFDMIDQNCINTISNFTKIGYRMAAIRELRSNTGWGIHAAKEWMNINFPK